MTHQRSPFFSRSQSIGTTRTTLRVPAIGPTLALIVLTATFALPLTSAAMLAAGVSQQDEGLLLVYPVQLLAGAIPNHDFLSVYGLASLLPIAGAFKLFGASVAAERTIGLIYHLLLSGSLVCLAWRWRGLVPAVTAGVICNVIAVALGPVAYAWVGGIALAAAGLLMADLGLRNGIRRGWCLGAGVCFGLALAYRIDLGLAIIIVVALICATQRAAWRPLIVGCGMGMSPLLVNVILAGPSAVISGQITGPIFVSGPGRSLPFENLDVHHQVLALLCVVLAVGLIALGGREAMTTRMSWTATRILVLGVLCAGALPEAFQRADVFHVDSVAVLVLPAGVILATGVHRGTGSVTRIMRPAAILVFGVALILAGLFEMQNYETAIRPTLAGTSTPTWNVTNLGRSAPVYSGDEYVLLQNALTIVDAHSRPGMRVFVGPQDLRRTSFGDTYLYFLMPQLTPSSFFLEMEPGITNASDSRLASDIAHSDILVLTNAYDNFFEPNASSIFGSDAPNAVVKNDFVEVGNSGPWNIYVRATPQGVGGAT